MKINVYTKDDKVKYIELNLEVGEYFVLQKALLNFAGNMDESMADRILAVMMTDNMNEKEQIELEEFN